MAQAVKWRGDACARMMLDMAHQLARRSARPGHRALGTDSTCGLSSEEVSARLKNDGPNVIRQAKQRSLLAILLRQFLSFVIWVLIGAAVVSVALGERLDGIVIIAIVVLNALIGFVQEYRAERAAQALAELIAPRARVIRDGQPKTVPAAEIARGDLIILGEGDVVAADARLVDTAMMRTNEAALTGGFCRPKSKLSICR